MLTHPPWLIRDTSQYGPLRNKRNRPQKLKTLAKMYLNAGIQEGEHHPEEDAQAALLVFRQFKAEWEQSIKVKPKSKK